MALSRRSVLTLGGGGISTLLLRPGSIFPTADEESRHHTFILEPGLIGQVDVSTGKVLRVTGWELKDAKAWPQLMMPFSTSLDSVETLAARKSDRTVVGSSEGESSVTSVFEAGVSGLLELDDMSAEAVEMAVGRSQLSLDLSFLYPSGYEQLARAKTGTLPATKTPAIKLLSSLPPNIDMYGWRLQFRPPETHPLGSCVASPVTHFHCEVFRKRPDGRYTYVLNVHLGTYRDGGRRCFVLYNNTRPIVCWRTCNPSRNDLVQMFKWVILAAAAIAAVSIAGWIVVAIAAAAGSIMYVPLLVLV